MTAAVVLREALQELGQTLETDLDLDEDGECQLDTGAGDEILISAIDEMDMVCLLVPLLTVSEAQRERLLQEALMVNLDLTLTGTTRIGYDGEGLALCEALPVEGLDAGVLWASVETVILLGREIREHLQSGGTVDETVSTLGSSGPPPVNHIRG